MRDVDVSCVFRDVRFANGGVLENVAVSGFANMRASKLGHNDTMTVECPVDTAMPARADVVLSAGYGLPFVPFWRTTTAARFVGAAGGAWQWRRQPVP